MVALLHLRPPRARPFLPPCHARLSTTTTRSGHGTSDTTRVTIAGGGGGEGFFVRRFALPPDGGGVRLTPPVVDGDFRDIFLARARATTLAANVSLLYNF